MRNKKFKSTIVLTLLAVLLSSVLCLTFANDSLGLVGGIISGSIDNVKGVDSDMAVKVYMFIATIIGFCLTRLFQWILKKFPTKWTSLGVNFAWKIATLFFGRNIIYYNQKMKDESAESTARQKTLAHLQKHHSILRVDMDKFSEKHVKKVLS